MCVSNCDDPNNIPANYIGNIMEEYSEINPSVTSSSEPRNFGMRGDPVDELLHFLAKASTSPGSFDS